MHLTLALVALGTFVASTIVPLSIGKELELDESSTSIFIKQ